MCAKRPHMGARGGARRSAHPEKACRAPRKPTAHGPERARQTNVSPPGLRFSPQRARRRAPHAAAGEGPARGHQRLEARTPCRGQRGLEQPLSTTGANDSDVFVVKLDPAGAYIWSKRFGDAANQLGGEVAIDSTGDVYLAGVFNGAIDFGTGSMASAGSTDIYIGKLASSNGAGLQAKRFGDASAQVAHAIAVDGANNVLVVGTYSGSVDFGGGALPNAGALTGFYGTRLTSTLGHVWSKQFGSGSTGGASQTMDVGLDPAGNLYLTATFGSSLGAMTVNFGGSNITSSQFAWTLALARLDAAGAHVWSKAIGPGVVANTGKVVADPLGNPTLAGWFSTAVDFGGGALACVGNANLFLAKLSSAGQHLWSKRFGSNQPALHAKVAIPAIDPVSSAILLGGNNLGDVDFGSGPLTTAGGPADAVLSKFAP